jgi:hypothetical protein
MKVNYATLTVFFFGLVAASPAAKADGHENLEVYKEQCDWIDPDCKIWDFVSCTCKDSIYVSRSNLGNCPQGSDNKNPSSRNPDEGKHGGQCRQDHRCRDSWDSTKCKCHGRWCNNHDPHCNHWNWDSCTCNWHNGNLQVDQCPKDHRCRDSWDSTKCKCHGRWCNNHDPHCNRWNWDSCSCDSHNGQCPKDHRCRDSWDSTKCKCHGRWCNNHDPHCNHWNWETCTCNSQKFELV